MNIQIHNFIEQYPNTLIVPVEKGSNYEKTIQQIATLSGIEASRLTNDFTAKAKEVHIFYTQNEGVSPKICLLGLGEKPAFAEVLRIFRSFAFRYKSKLPKDIGIYLLNNAHASNTIENWVDGAVNGLLLGLYDIGLYKTKEKTTCALQGQDAQLDIFVDGQAFTKAQMAVENGRATAETQARILDLVNAPHNKMTASMLANWAMKSGKTYGFETTVLGGAEIELLGMGAMLAVNRGSEEAPAFIIMEYKGGNSDSPRVGLVGKGITYDTGGLSIKTRNMHYMKSDMGGAAAVLGTMELTAKLQLPIHLIGIVPATDNCVDAKSIKPGDVVSSFSGKTIEIIDTDAEGRLVLADGVAYMNKVFRPDIMIDLATLTGSVVQALGYEAGGLFTNNNDLSAQLQAAGDDSGERLWQLPLWKSYFSDMQSDIADIKNYSGKPTSGAITAAKFIEFFTNEHPAWAHLDIAGVAFGGSEFAKDKSGTAYGVRLLTTFLKKVSIA